MLRFLVAHVFLVLVSVESFSQVLNKTIPFNIGTAYLEPDGRDLSLKLNNDEFITLAKAKGGVMGTSSYVLEKFTKDFKSVFKVALTAELEEDFFKLTFYQNTLRLFSTIHDSIIVDTPSKNVDQIGRLMFDSIEAVPALCKQVFGYDFSLPLTSEVQYGPNKKDMQDLTFST